MTREEAIDRLKEARIGHKEFLSVEVINMAIKALEQELKLKQQGGFEVIRSTESLEREDRRLKEIQMYKAELKMYAEAREIGKRVFGL